jgi:D-xylono/L-arabinono-1,4-lactonase
MSQDLTTPISYQETLSILVDCRCENAEGPLWHPDEQRLYWTDIPAGHLFRYDPVTQTTEQIYQGESVGGFTIQTDGSLILFKARGAIEHWNEGKVTPIISELPQERESRFNDVIVDPMGRIFCGTMPSGDRPGSLYRLDLDGSLTTVIEGLGQPNGMGFSPDRHHFYCTDTLSGKIYQFDYDPHTGEIQNQQVLISIPSEAGMPDGMTVDAEGYIWSARWDGQHLFRYRPDGTQVLQIPFPAKKISSVTFGGSDYTELFVTSAGGNDRPTEGSGAGAIFSLKLGIQGVPEFSSRIQIPNS